MEEFSNSAQRLLTLIQQVASKPDNVSTSQTWAEVFGIDGTIAKNDPHDVNTKLHLVRKEVDVIEADTALPVTLIKATDAIEISSDIPLDAKEAVKDFVRDNWENFEDVLSNLETLSDLIGPLSDMGVQVPERIMEYMPILLEIFKSIGG